MKFKNNHYIPPTNKQTVMWLHSMKGRNFYRDDAIEVQHYKEHFSSSQNDTEVSISIYKQKLPRAGL